MMKTRSTSMASTPVCVELTETSLMTRTPEKGGASIKGDASVPIKVGHLTSEMDDWGRGCLHSRRGPVAIQTQ